MSRMGILVILGVAIAQWLAMAVWSLSSAAPFPARGLRRSERGLALGVIILLATWMTVFDARKLASKTTAAAPGSPALSSRGSGTCASVSHGAKAGRVRELLGEPDKIESDEDARGPGAQRWVYRDSRCTLHMFDNAVEFIE